MLKIVLASRSPRRKKLLSQVGIEFQVVPSTSDEIITSQKPEDVVLELAKQKALEVALTQPNSLVIGADTIVVYNRNILGKPKDEYEAIQMLQQLSGNVHQVFTGVSLIKTSKDKSVLAETSFFQQTKVTFSSLSLREIEAYVSTGSPLDKAGAYGIQDDWGAVFVENIEGDYYNVVGFPLNRFYRELKQFEPSLVPGISIPV
ncbi:MAG: Maf family protein [Balneolales bacterium]|nr:Maf family protein [Balneolales bacterium]